MDDDRLTQFLYILVRDHLPIGTVNEIIHNFMTDKKVSYSNDHIEAWAKVTAERIMGKSHGR